MVKIKDYRRRSPKQFTIFLLMKKELFLVTNITSFGIGIGSPGMG